LSSPSQDWVLPNRRPRRICSSQVGSSYHTHSQQDGNTYNESAQATRTPHQHVSKSDTISAPGHAAIAALPVCQASGKTESDLAFATRERMELVYVGVISFVLVLRTVRRMRTALLEVYVVLGLAVPETFVLFWTVLIQYISSKNWLRGSLQGSDDHR
jgi:hypothetical protein